MPGSYKVESIPVAAWLEPELTGEKHPEDLVDEPPLSGSNTTARKKKQETFCLQHNADSKINIIKGSLSNYRGKKK